MPQMAPYSWFMLNIYFNLIIMIFIIYTHSLNFNSSLNLFNKFNYKMFKIKW